MTVFFWNLEQNYFSNIRYFTHVRWTSQFLHGTRKTRRSLTGHTVRKDYTLTESCKTAWKGEGVEPEERGIRGVVQVAGGERRGGGRVVWRRRGKVSRHRRTANHSGFCPFTTHLLVFGAVELGEEVPGVADGPGLGQFGDGRRGHLGGGEGR